MTPPEKNLLDLLVGLNKLERDCQRVKADIAVPPVVYELVGKLRDALARWGTECIIEERHKK